MSTSEPIPIATPPHQMSSHSPHPQQTGVKDTPGSSASISPQTPFLPNQGLSNLSSTAPNQSSSVLQWARSFKSPPAQPSMTLGATGGAGGSGSPPSIQQKGFDIPSINAQNHDHDHDHDEHDSFEFGDLSSRTWGKMGRRAVSMSVPSGQGISGMLSGFGPTSPPKGADSLGVGSPPAQMSSSVLADKTARGQGVLRRLSIGSGFAKPPMFSPPLAMTSSANPQQQQQQSALTASAPTAQDLSPPAADTVQRANTLGARGRRLSDSGGKKRGVSPLPPDGAFELPAQAQDTTISKQ